MILLTGILFIVLIVHDSIQNGEASEHFKPVLIQKTANYFGFLSNFKYIQTRVSNASMFIYTLDIYSGKAHFEKR